MSATRSKREAARFLGLNEFVLKNLIKKHRIDDYFKKKLDKAEELA